MLPWAAEFALVILNEGMVLISADWNALTHLSQLFWPLSPSSYWAGGSSHWQQLSMRATILYIGQVLCKNSVAPLVGFCGSPRSQADSLGTIASAHGCLFLWSPQ